MDVVAVAVFDYASNEDGTLQGAGNGQTQHLLLYMAAPSWGRGGGCSNGSESGRKMTECERFVDVRGAGVIIPDTADFPTQPEQSNKYI